MNKFRLNDITIEITNKCNLKCKLCNIWKEKERNLSFKDIKNSLSYLSNLYAISSVSITGGEPFLHPQFEKIIKFLTLLKMNKKIKSIGIYSNGYDTDIIKNFLKKMGKYLFGLSIGISLDGLEEEHNFLRGKNDAFKSTLKTIEYINGNFKELINLELKLTINKLNYSQIYEIYEYCKKRNIFFSPKFAEYNVRNYYHRKEPINKSNFIKDKKAQLSIGSQLVKILKKENKEKNKSINPKIIEMLLGITKFQKDFIKSCLTPLKCLFITCEGNLYPCLYLDSIGSIKEIEKIVFGAGHQKIIKKGLKGECPRCFAYHGFLKSFNFRFNNP